jgi:hypothetical protein
MNKKRIWVCFRNIENENEAYMKIDHASLFILSKKSYTSISLDEKWVIDHSETILTVRYCN